MAAFLTAAWATPVSRLGTQDTGASATYGQGYGNGNGARYEHMPRAHAVRGHGVREGERTHRVRGDGHENALTGAQFEKKAGERGVPDRVEDDWGQSGDVSVVSEWIRSVGRMFGLGEAQGHKKETRRLERDGGEHDQLHRQRGEHVVRRSRETDMEDGGRNESEDDGDGDGDVEVHPVSQKRSADRDASGVMRRSAVSALTGKVTMNKQDVTEMVGLIKELFVSLDEMLSKSMTESLATPGTDETHGSTGETVGPADGGEVGEGATSGLMREGHDQAIREAGVGGGTAVGGGVDDDLPDVSVTLAEAEQLNRRREMERRAKEVEFEHSDNGGDVRAGHNYGVSDTGQSDDATPKSAPSYGHNARKHLLHYS